ncbi:MAG: DnaB-like helicase N-terminal domain-containing protein, partial [Thermoanaerobaculia bacterium]
AQRVADRLGLEFSSVWARVRAGGGDPAGGTRERAVAAPISSGEKQALRALLHASDPGELIGILREEYFDDPDCRSIFRVARERISSGQPLDFSEIATDLRGESELTRLSELALAPDEKDDDSPKSLGETARLMERRYLDRRLREITTEIRTVREAGDLDRERALDDEKMQLSRRLHALK